MTTHRTHTGAPLWMSDARIRRMIADAVRRRRAKRRRELALFEAAVRNAGQAAETNK
ncbi:MAG: hypothetical protein ABL893_18460 [Hyphomicrobium sp.]|nr:hypothetical protein [Hyphomicrobium sp.]